MTEPTDLAARIEVVQIRDVFPNEAGHFTPWLEANIEALSERLGLNLTVREREKAVGDFSVDLLCDDGDGKLVIVENQLERTDHDHLGKLLTYLVNLDAATAIWVTTEPRQEHQRVVTWLNDSTPADRSFYLVRVEAIRIQGSPCAPLFTILASPDPQSKLVGAEKKEMADQDRLRLEFWKALLELSGKRTSLFANVSAGRAHWISAGAGKSGVTYVYVLLKDRGAVELYIDRTSADENKAIFDHLSSHREAIDAEYHATLEWQRLEEKRASRIRSYIDCGGFTTPETWPKLQEQMVDAMVRFEKAIAPRLRQVWL